METPEIRFAEIFSGAPVIFQDWTTEAYGNRSARWKEVQEALISTGTAANESDALVFVRLISEDVGGDGAHFAYADLTGEDTASLYMSQLRERLKKNQERSKNPYRFFGTLGHQAIPQLFVSDLYKPRTKILSASDGQLSLSLDRQLSFFEDGFGGGGFSVELVDSARRLKWNYAKTIFKSVERSWKYAKDAIEENDRGRFHEAITQLRKSLAPVYGIFVDKIALHKYANEEAVLIALTSWARAALYYRNETGKRILFREVRVTGRKPGGFSGGRLDALELKRADGLKFSKSELRTLQKLSGSSFISAGHLLLKLSSFFGDSIVAVIRDWKFAVGDGVDGKIIRPSDVREKPIPAHLRQILRYLSFVTVDHADLCRKLKKDSWPFFERFGLRGALEYFLPEEVVVHEVDAKISDLKLAFKNETSELDEAPRRAQIRKLWNKLLLSAIKLLDGKEMEVYSRPILMSSSGELFQKELTPVEFANHHRKIPEKADVFGIIEVRGVDSKGEARLVMRYDKLIEAVESGEVRVKGAFIIGKELMISCPLHNERTPSMWLYLQREKKGFKCFGCGKSGQIDEKSIPPDADIVVMPSYRKSVIERDQLWSVPVIPEFHHRIMSLAQRILQENFRHSEGERYLAKARGLDTDLAYKMGAGFANDNLIHVLLDLEYTLDDLIACGLVKISPKVFSATITNLLLRRGMKMGEIVREFGKSQKKGVITGYPWSMLQGRVTFPLEMDGRLTKFYGRATDDRGLKHMKSSGNVVQGGFNMGVLKTDIKEVFLVEAAICAITLHQMGYSNVIAKIGPKIWNILDAIIRSGKNLAIGLDIDANEYATGQTKTVEIMEYVKKVAPHIGVRNFTADFVRQYGISDFKDFNGWWVDHGRFRTPNW
uniref:Zinc finger CHC2-type domain-containing protein n=1 Tax=Candidatus Giovannonibacteria bacterium GW2011_GWF2_42_19 TaxID=1618659 RepID=A0A0G1BJ18_9BACT|nr:MAG: hypothetical protein UV11_C0031G0021 [Candidatus Giovannonibacteria bacterium GW2011_GWF2_42_19]